MARENRILATLERLHAAEPKTRQKAIEALSRLNEVEMSAQIIAPLRSIVALDEARKVRAAAARLLGELKEPQAIEALHGALSDRSALVRGPAVRALAVARPPELLQWILPLAGDKGITVRAAVSEVLIAYIPFPVGLVCREMVVPSTKNSRGTMLEVLAEWQYGLKVDAARLVLACAEITPAQRWDCLGLLSAARPNSLFASRQLVYPQRFVEIVVQSGSEPPEVRQGAQAVLDYLSLGRASQSDFRAERAELMRAAKSDVADEDGSALLRGAESAPFAEPEAESLFTRLIRWMTGH